MNIKISITLFILLSFLNIGAVSDNYTINNNLINVLETNIRSVSEFEENGVKLQYRTKENLEKETSRVRTYLTQSISGNYEEKEKNQFQFSNRDLNINVKMWCEDKYNYVEIVAINENSKYFTINLTDILKKLINKKSENVKYFSYCEGKILDENYSIDKFINNNNLEKTELLKINNGYTGTGYLKDSGKINFALIKYDTGSHIIIGTPIIFTTY